MFIQQSNLTKLVNPRITVMQGQVEVTIVEDVQLTTVLGSCIAACLFDPIAKVGGMNHFLLAEPSKSGNAQDQIDEHYGLFLMELLVNKMMKAGALKSRMKGHLYGGANLHRQMRAIGTANAEFAERFLNAEGIEIRHKDVGGNCARRVDFLAAQGKARCRHVVETAIPKIAPLPIGRPAQSGEVELF